ncbi:hypothetical protein C2W62_53125, partial [Candidatus Entotheonella serta]
RTRHDASAPGDFPLVHGFATPVCDHVPIDVDQFAALGRQQDRKLAEKLTERRCLIAGANKRL